MTNLFEILTPEAQKELVRDRIVELVTVIVRAAPHPDRPRDRLAMQIVAEARDEFAPGVPGIDTAMARIREICEPAGDDLSVQVQDALLVSLNRRRKDLDGLREGKIGGHPVAYLADPQMKEFLRPILAAARPDVTVWSLAWTVGMDDDGKLLVDCEDSLSGPDCYIAVKNAYDDSIYAEDRDRESEKKIRQRIREVNDIVGRIVREHME